MTTKRVSHINVIIVKCSIITWEVETEICSGTCSITVVIVHHKTFLQMGGDAAGIVQVIIKVTRLLTSLYIKQVTTPSDAFCVFVGVTIN